MGTLMKKTTIALMLSLAWLIPAYAQFTTMDIGAADDGAPFVGPADLIASPVICWSLRACSNAKIGSRVAQVCNAGKATCVDVVSNGAGDFDVTTAQGSPLNCGGAGGTCTIATMYDQSANGNDVFQVTEANAPILVFNCLNGKPCLSYDGVRNLATATSTGGGSQPFVMSMVAQRTGTFTTQGTVIAVDNNGAQILFASTANNVAIYAGFGVPTATANDSVTHAIAGLYNGASSNINVDGTGNSVTLGPGGTNPIGTINLCFGVGVVGSCSGNPLTGFVGEAIVWNGDQSASFTALCHNQRLYFGSAGSC